MKKALFILSGQTIHAPSKQDHLIIFIIMIVFMPPIAAMYMQNFPEVTYAETAGLLAAGYMGALTNAAGLKLTKGPAHCLAIVLCSAVFGGLFYGVFSLAF